MYGRGESEQQVAALINRLGPEPLMPFKSDEFIRWKVQAFEPAKVDPETGEWRAVGTGPSRSTEQLFFEPRGQLVAIQLSEPYTHLWLGEPNKDGSRQAYLLSIPSFPRYMDLPDPFVMLHGAINWYSRSLAYQKASAVVVPSRSEPFGMVVLEAMQMGVPVFYPSPSGVAEVVEAGTCIESEDYADIASRIADMLTDPVQWDSKAEAQIDEISTYSSRGYEKMILEIWKQVAQNRGLTAV
jgi:glycosyltransferase involved in cell wall biosynthesis